MDASPLDAGESIANDGGKENGQPGAIVQNAGRAGKSSKNWAHQEKCPNMGKEIASGIFSSKTWFHSPKKAGRHCTDQQCAPDGRRNACRFFFRSGAHLPIHVGYFTALTKKRGKPFFERKERLFPAIFYIYSLGLQRASISSTPPSRSWHSRFSLGRISSFRPSFSQSVISP